ncbi:hypothetical protein AOR_1_1110154 [Paecilomyces variotii No. 5]|uniref:Uncharacterized protein n=1 Tax=Byssochlamys spectabilis (strain No. 5 / NBRC 109023) TaxID=1356009 RepID=V5FGB7_BYSSN|nr:hypothetical protein AOR_1_1110154 [Paecilomyces variotii No. 5]
MEDVRPTAKWGYRMLRPLKSIYNRLEKYRLDQARLDDAPRQSESLEISYSQVAALGKKPDGGDEYSAAGSDREDPSWIPGKIDKRRIRHKYTARSEGTGRRRLRSVLRSPEVQRKLPGAIEIGTPLITGRLSDRYSNDAVASQESDSQSITQTESRRRGKRSKSGELHYPAGNSAWHDTLNRSGDTNLKQILQSLNRVLFTFLAGTRVSDSQKRPARGSRSLLSMAARQLPEFISQEQKRQDELDEDGDIDMEDAYFTELEALYAPNGTGWRPLREAVRAQGIHLVSDMIRNNWLTDSVTNRLLRECIDLREFDAFETLFSSRLQYLGEHANSETPGDLFRCHTSLKLLQRYYEINPGPYVFDELAKALSWDVLPPHGFIGMNWDQAIHNAVGSLSKMDSSFATASRLIEAVILWASGILGSDLATQSSTGFIPSMTASRETRTSAICTDNSVQYSSAQDTISNLILSLVTALCSMHIVRSCDSSTGTTNRSVMQDILSGLALTVKREVELRQPSNKNAIPTWQLLRRGSILVGDYLIQCSRCNFSEPIAETETAMTSRLDSFIRCLAGQREVVKEMSFLTQQVIHCCERAISDHGRYTRYVDSMFSCFAPTSSRSSLSSFLGKIAVEVAMDLAERSQDSEDHTRAADLQERLARCHTDTQLASQKLPDELHPRIPYRWEESIGEWVASTPCPKIKSSQGISASKPLVVLNRGLSPSPLPSSVESYSSLAESETSVTSSPPSSLKRNLEEDDPEREGKRLCTTSFTSRGSFTEPRELSPDDIVPDSEDEDDPISMWEPPKFDNRQTEPLARQTPRRYSNAGTTDGQNDLPRNPRVEVVIVHKKMDDYNVRPVHVAQGRLRHSMDSYLHRSPDNRKTRPRSSFARRTSLVIPCSQDDSSEDELSFL